MSSIEMVAEAVEGLAGKEGMLRYRVIDGTARSSDEHGFAIMWVVERINPDGDNSEIVSFDEKIQAELFVDLATMLEHELRNRELNSFWDEHRDMINSSALTLAEGTARSLSALLYDVEWMGHSDEVLSSAIKRFTENLREL